MGKIQTTIKMVLAAAMIAVAPASTTYAQKSTGWGDFKLFLDPGHAADENCGLWGYSEAKKVFAVAQYIKGYLTDYTDMFDDGKEMSDKLLLCRNNDSEIVDLEERSESANAWGADFFYSIHSEHSVEPADVSTTATLFGGWRKDGVDIEKTPNGGKAFGEILNPNLTGVMRITTRGNLYDRCYYEPTPDTHTDQNPYLSVNRRTNMPSLVSEGGCHTIAAQQQPNINADYKRLEAFAAFQSILKFRGMQNPVQTFLTGIITNSDNEVPIDGVTVTVDGKTYVTDTWESTFKNYTDDPDLIHNGFYLFENLTPDQSYDVTFEAKGYDTVTETVTIKSDPQGQSNDNVTWLDVSMTSNVPAKVVSTTVDDPQAVRLLDPLVITFSRKMDRESVEQAFSIDNDGQVTLTWVDDCTLSIDVSQLTMQQTYNITIDGSIAKNSLTNQLLDGNGDGEGGDNYTLTITMNEKDEDPPVVVKTEPVADGEVIYTMRPVVRVEYNEILDWNEEKNGDAIYVIDKDRKKYSGKLTHTVINGVSVLQYFFDEDLPLDQCFHVVIKSGLADMSGNLTERYTFRFLSEYRKIVSSNDLLTLDNVSGFWQPDGSGSSTGLTPNANSFTNADFGDGLGSCALLKYDFDPNSSGGKWQIRDYYSLTNVNATTIDGILTYWVYGDGSNNKVSAALRIRTNNRNRSIVYAPKTVDFRGWQLFTWDLTNDKYELLIKQDEEPLTGWWRFDSFVLTHENTDAADVGVPRQAWKGEIGFNQMKFVKFDNTAVRTAELIDFPTDVAEKTVDSNILVVALDYAVSIKAESTIRIVDIYNTAGVKVASATPGAMTAIVDTDNLPGGIYVVRVVTDDDSKSVKIAR